MWMMNKIYLVIHNEKKFYGDNSKEIVEIIKRVIDEDPKFVANLSMYARKEMHLGTIYHMIIGEMTMLRNLKNIIKSDVSNINKVYEFLADENRVLKNKQLPFRYYSAYKTLRNEGIGTSKIFDTLEIAIRHSTKNINKLSGKTFISADVSGSMNSAISSKSEMTCAEIAVLIMSIANYICEETITTTFDTNIYRSDLSNENGIIANASSIRAGGGGDVCQKYVDEYKSKINPKVWVHAIDMQGYGTQQFKGDKVNIIAGWNEKVLDFIYQAEKGIGSLRREVENYYFKG